MQYLISVIDDTAGLATPSEMAAIDVFNDRLQAEGHWVVAGGLASPSTAIERPPAHHERPGRREQLIGDRSVVAFGLTSSQSCRRRPPSPRG